MPIEKQLSIFVDNKPGRLAKICQILAESGVNVYAMSIHDTVDHAIIRLVVDNPNKALIMLEEEGVYIVTQDVVLLTVENKAGVMSRIASKLFRADINIQYAYCTVSKNQDFGCIVLKTEDAEQTVEILSDL